MTPNHPKEIANRFQVKSILGQGGIGFVYEAYDPSLAKTVAIKTLKEGLPSQSIVRFQQEAVAIAKLKHKNIIDVYDFGIDGNTPYLVMELLKGHTLAELIKSPEWKSINLKDILEIFVQICDGLVHAHDTGVLHRDIKPSNIMLLETEDKNSVVKLVDFGLAKLDGENQSITSTGAALGSPLYMSPEQVAGENLDAHTDIYSLGCVMYETICGSPPFKGESAAETMVMHRQAAIPEIVPVFHTEEIPKQLLMLVRSCLQKKKNDRPSKVSTIQRILADTIAEITPVETFETETPKYEFFSLHALPKISNLGKIIISVFSIVVLVGILYTQQKSQKQIDKLIEEYPTIKKAFPEQQLLINRQKLAESVESHLIPKFKKDPKTQILIASFEVDDEFVLTLKNKSFKKLSLNNTLIRGKTLSTLKDKQLTYLDLAHTKIRNPVLANLSEFKTLKDLNISNCKRLTNKGFKHLLSLKKLDTLYLKSKQVNDDTAKIVSKMSSLKTLSIEGPSMLTDTGFSYLTKLKMLLFLSVRGTAITSASLTKLKLFPRLTRLNIGALELKNDDIRKVVKLKPYLKELCVSGNFDLNKDGYRYLKDLKKIDTLNVARSNFSDESLEDVLSTRPRSLDVSNSKVTGKGIEIIAKTDSIEDLNISRLNLTDSDVACLSKMKNLSDLKVDYNKISDKSLLQFAKIKTLKSIVLKGTAITSKANENSNSEITVKGLKHFVKELPSCIIVD